MTESAITKNISAVMLGAGLLAFVYVVVTPRLLPDAVSLPADLPKSTTAAVRWLVGIGVGVIVMAAWYLLRATIRGSRAVR